MIYKTSRRVCRFSAILALLMVFGPLCGAAWSQKTSPQKSSQTQQYLPTSVPTDPTRLDWFIAARYSVFGPASLNSVNSKSLGFARGYGLPALTINLTNKNVKVMNQAGASLPFSALEQGGRVIVCDRRDSVVIITVPPREEGYVPR
jgi:hypothetical protein